MNKEVREPLAEVELDGCIITLLGTAHVSRSSAEKVEQLLASGRYNAVAVELCPSRHHAIVNPDNLEKMDIFRVIREGKVPMVTASLALGAYQQRLAEQFGIKPGAEMRAAIESADSAGLPVLLIDREIGVTLKRIYRSVRWWRRLYLLSGLFAGLVTREKVSEEQVERLKEGDMLETIFAEFSEQAHDLYEPLIDERDRYMAARIRMELDEQSYDTLLVVIGAGHLQGIQRYLREDHTPPADVIEELDQMPAPSRWPKVIPWLVVLLVLSGFAVGFSRSTDLGWRLVMDWVLINGGLSSLGAVLATAHPLTVVGAFIAAPLTSLNPMVGAGMVTAAIESWVRRPRVGDFSRLREDTAHFRGWRKNSVARILLVFILSTLGSGVGTYLAGFRILERLAG